MTGIEAGARHRSLRNGLPEWVDSPDSTNQGNPVVPLGSELSELLYESTDADRPEVAIEEGYRRMDNLLRSPPARNRMASLSVLLARLHGCSFEEASVIVGRDPEKLLKFLHGEATIPEKAMARVRRIDEVLRNLHKVLEPSATARWFRTGIPSLGNESPLIAISKGKLRQVEEVTTSYVMPAVHS